MKDEGGMMKDALRKRRNIKDTTLKAVSGQKPDAALSFVQIGNL